MMAIGVLAFVVALLVSVMLHEAGHFLAAKRFGMKATQFFVGFGPTLWSRQKGETEYGVKAIPAGGFVKIIGMTPLEEVAPEDKDRTFMSKGGWQRFVVLVAGSTVHFVIALVLFFVLLVAWPSVVKGPGAVASVQNCIAASGADDCGSGAAAAPAKGVLQKGDVILAVDGKAVEHGATSVVGLTREAPAGPITFTIKRDGATRDVTLTPVLVDGQPRVGIGLDDAPSATLARVGLPDAVTGSFSLFGQVFTGSFRALGHVPHEVGQILSGHQGQRDLTSGDGSQVTSVVGVAQISGEAFQKGGVSGGTAMLVSIVASVNLFVGIFNLFPLLPLDGGHVAILGYEKARDAIRKRRRLPAAGPVDLTKLMPLTYSVLALIVTVAAVLVFADIANPVQFQ